MILDRLTDNFPWWYSLYDKSLNGNKEWGGGGGGGA